MLQRFRRHVNSALLVDNSKKTIIALLATLLLLVANASERIVYEFADLPFLVKIGAFIAFVAGVVMLLLHVFNYIDIYKLIFQK